MKFKLLMAIFLLWECAFSTTYYATPNGTSNANGTSFNNGLDILTAIGKMKSGDSLKLDKGTFKIKYTAGSKNTITLSTKNTSSSKMYIIGDVSRSKIDFQFPVGAWVQDSWGLSLTGNYYYLKNITITRAGYQGVYVQGDHNTFENCVFFDNRNTGLEINKGGSNTLVLNCDAYYNYDPKKFGSMADGFGPKQTQGPGNTFIGCRAWENSDDGFDLYDSPQKVIIKDCWTFRNGVDVYGIGSSFAGNGNGFKIGGLQAVGNHEVYNSVSFGHPAKGFDQNNNYGGVKVYNCTSYNNKDNNFGFGGTLASGEKNDFRNNLSVNGTVNIKNATEKNNSWNLGITASSSYFKSVDTTLTTKPRNADGSLQYTDFLVPKNSAIIDKGIDVGIAYNGTAPDLGYYETGAVVINYTLTVNTSTGGTISPSSGTYGDGATVSVTATPQNGYTFTGWTGSLSGTTNPTTITLSSNKTIGATFEKASQYSVTSSVSGKGVITPSIDGLYLAGTTLSFTVLEYIGYSFSNWSGDLTSSNKRESITINGNVSINATFTQTSSVTSYEFEDGYYEASYAKFEDINVGFSSAGYVNTENIPNAWTEITVYAPTAGDYDFTLHYAVSGDRPIVVTVDGKSGTTIAGTSTGAFTTWGNESFVLTLSEGKNVLRFTGTESLGAPNLDKVDVKKKDDVTSIFANSPSSENITVAPTPSDNVCRVLINSKTTEDIKMSLCDINDKVIFATYVVLTKGKNVIDISQQVSGIKSGVYFVVIDYKNGKKEFKQVVKTH